MRYVLEVPNVGSWRVFLSFPEKGMAEREHSVKMQEKEDKVTGQEEKAGGPPSSPAVFAVETRRTNRLKPLVAGEGDLGAEEAARLYIDQRGRMSVITMGR